MPAGETASIADIPTALEKAKDGVSAAAVEDAVRMPVDNAAKQKSAIEQFKKGYQAAKKTIRAVNDRINGITNTINDLANQTTLEVASISGAVIQLLQSPGLFLGNCAARVQQFVILARRIMADLPAAISFSADRIAAAMTGELWLSAIAAGMGTAILENPPSTRAEALTVLRLYRECADESRAALDALAEATRGEPLRNQYAPGAASTEALLRLRAAVQRYLIGAAYSLSSERRITLESDRSPLELCVTEMGASSGDFDQKYAALCSWNNWHGRDLLLVGRGKEAAIYD
jgi:hypothetical protein